MVTYSKRLTGSSSTANQLSFSIFSGPQTTWPKINSKGIEAQSLLDGFSSCKDQEGNAFIPILQIFKTVASHQRLMKSLNGSLWLGVICWRSVLGDFQLVHHLLKNCRHKVWPVVRLYVLGEPHKCKEFFKCFDYSVGSDIPKGIASGNLVTVYIIVNRLVFPDLVLGKGPTQSTSIQLNCSSTGGIGFSRATGGFWLGFPTIWQVWQPLQNLTTSLWRSGQ